MKYNRLPCGTYSTDGYILFIAFNIFHRNFKGRAMIFSDPAMITKIFMALFIWEGADRSEM